MYVLRNISLSISLVILTKSAVPLCKQLYGVYFYMYFSISRPKSVISLEKKPLTNRSDCAPNLLKETLIYSCFDLCNPLHVSLPLNSLIHMNDMSFVGSPLQNNHIEYFCP